MAFKLLIICALFVVTTNANFPWPSGFPPFKMPPMPQMPQFTFPTFKPIEIPSAEDIINRPKSGPNTNYNGIVVKSASSSKTVNGETVTEGGTYVYSDNNGDIHEVAFGDKPPVLKKSDSSATTSATRIPHDKITSEKKSEATISQVQVLEPSNLINQINSESFVAADDNGAKAFQSVFSNGGGANHLVFSSVGSAGGFASASSSSVSASGFASSFSSSNVDGIKRNGVAVSTVNDANGNLASQTIHYSD